MFANTVDAIVDESRSQATKVIRESKSLMVSEETKLLKKTNTYKHLQVWKTNPLQNIAQT